MHLVLLLLSAIAWGLAGLNLSATYPRPYVPPPAKRKSNKWYMYRAFDGTPRPNDGMPPNFKVAFFADNGLERIEPQSGKVLALVSQQKADMVIHSGDLDYHNRPQEFDAQITRHLGPQFPYFFSPGNHDTDYYVPRGFQEILMRRARGAGALCTGEAGIHSWCTYKGFSFILSGFQLVGYPLDRHEFYIEEHLRRARGAVWTACTWHRAPGQLQLGHSHERLVTFNNGFDAFDVCREHGAFVVTAHTHLYSRTHLMSNFSAQEVASRDQPLVLQDGTNFHAVVGTGGWGLHNFHPWYHNAQKKSDLSKVPRFFAAAACKELGLSPGALFCTYNVGGVMRRGRCDFIDIRGAVHDSFTLLSQPDPADYHFSRHSTFRCPSAAPVGALACCSVHPRAATNAPAEALPAQIRTVWTVAEGDPDAVLVSPLNSSDWGASYSACVVATRAVRVTLEVRPAEGPDRGQDCQPQGPNKAPAVPGLSIAFTGPSDAAATTAAQRFRLHSLEEHRQLHEGPVSYQAQVPGFTPKRPAADGKRLRKRDVQRDPQLAAPPVPIPRPPTAAVSRDEGQWVPPTVARIRNTTQSRAAQGQAEPLGGQTKRIVIQPEAGVPAVYYKGPLEGEASANWSYHQALGFTVVVLAVMWWIRVSHRWRSAQGLAER